MKALVVAMNCKTIHKLLLVLITMVKFFSISLSSSIRRSWRQSNRLKGVMKGTGTYMISQRLPNQFIPNSYHITKVSK